MSAHTELPPIAETDSWPHVELCRNPFGKMGVNVSFPLPDQVRADTGVDEFSMNMEPQRARRLRDQLTALLKDLGFE
jgi:hypothetical protein